MPLLSDEDQERLKSVPPEQCAKCSKTTKENYCRQCDMFFDDGHADTCPEMTTTEPYASQNHKGHRTY